jgi:hypothetical protein
MAKMTCGVKEKEKIRAGREYQITGVVDIGGKRTGE